MRRKISVIIPAHNEEKYIEDCITSIQKQKYSPKEIIVVSNGSTDNTVKVAKKLIKNVYSLKDPHVCVARNYGAQKATGEILVFLDADSVMKEDLLEDINRAIGKGNVGGTCKTFPLEDSKKAHLMYWIGNNIANNLFLLAHGIIFCTKEAFSGYREDVNLAEDTFMLRGLKKEGKICYIRSNGIKTSMRRHEKEGYIKSIIGVTKGYFIRKNHVYEPIR